ncbi:hypothetical protein C2S52_001510 [Perilla frutescens var. hirtella]|nr:hypothetical protein C2S52_001510 [Perilla frutescens var. hirtella]
MTMHSSKIVARVRMANPKELFAMFNDMYEKSVGTPSSTSTSTVTSNHTMTEHVGAKMDEPTRSHAPDLSIVKQDDKMLESVMSPTTTDVISVQDTSVSTSAAAQFFFSAHSDHDSAMVPNVEFSCKNMYSAMFVHDKGDLTVDLQYICHCILYFIPPEANVHVNVDNDTVEGIGTPNDSVVCIYSFYY